MNKQALAERAAEIMQREDEASRWLGMRVDEVRPGYARLSMRVMPQMVNGRKVCHGGLIFALADSGFGYAANSHNQHSVAASCSIDFLVPAQLGDELEAEAREVSCAGRSGIYDVRVTNQHRQVVALFRGKSVTVKGTWIE